MILKNIVSQIPPNGWGVILLPSKTDWTRKVMVEACVLYKPQGRSFLADGRTVTIVEPDADPEEIGKPFILFKVGWEDDTVSNRAFVKDWEQKATKVV